MTDLRNQDEDLRPSLSRELIAAGRGERASRSARLLATEALLSTGASAAGAAQAVSWLLPLKWFGISLLLLGSGDLLWRATRGSAVPAPVVARALPSGRTTEAAPILAARSAARPFPMAGPAGAASEPAHELALPLPSLPRVAQPTAPESGAVARDEQLRLELDALKAARQALEQGAPARALALLHAKAGGFSLLPVEAGIVRIEALARAGSETSARRLAEALLREHGSGPYAERLKALAGGVRSP